MCLRPAFAQTTGVTTLVSVNRFGTASANDFSNAVGLSSDARYVLFNSYASNLVPNDGNGTQDAFLRDLDTATTAIVSVPSGSSQAPNGTSRAVALTASGRFVLLNSNAALDPKDNNGLQDVYRYDRDTGTTVLLSVNLSGTAAGNGASEALAITADGQHALFVSAATDLAANDANGQPDVFVRHLAEGVTTLVSVKPSGMGSGNGPSTDAVMSDSGRYVAFTSLASDLTTTDDQNGRTDIFVRDLALGSTTLVSQNAQKTGSGSEASAHPRLSGNGQTLAFVSLANDLVAGDLNNAADVFVYDLATATTSLASIGTDGSSADGASGDDGALSLAANGRYLLFGSRANNLVLNDGNQSHDVFVRDLQTSITLLVSLSAAGLGSANADSYPSAISGDGRYVLFNSEASDIAPNDSNGASDTFVRDLAAGTTRLASARNSPPTTGNGASFGIALAAGRVVLLDSVANNLVANDANGANDVFVRDLDAELPTHAPSPSRTDTPTRTPTPTPTHTAPTSTRTATATVTPTRTHTPTVTPTITGLTYTPTRSPTRTATVTGTPSHSPTITPTRTQTATRTATASPSPTPPATPTQPTATHSPSRTPTRTRTETPTRTSTSTVTATETGLTQTPTRTPTATATQTGTVTATPTITATRTQTPTRTPTATRTATATWSTTRTATATSTPPPPLLGFTRLVSVDAGGTTGGNGHSSESTLSADGRFVVFTSAASNLIAGDTNGSKDIFLRDVELGQTTLISVSHAGTGGGNGDSSGPFLTPDARFVAFTSAASDLIADDGNPHADVFVRDRLNANTMRASNGIAAGVPPNGASTCHGISADGRFVLFSSLAGNLVANDVNNASDVFVHDRVTGSTMTVSMNSAGTGTGNQRSFAPAISTNGQVVTFLSDASDLVAGDTNNVTDVFARHLLTGVTTLVSANVGTIGNGASGSNTTPAISADGRYVVFLSSASNLVGNDLNGAVDVFWRDLNAPAPMLVTANLLGTGSGNGNALPFASLAPISADGRYVLFNSEARNLVQQSTFGPGGVGDAYVRDVDGGCVSGCTALLDTNMPGTAGGNAGGIPVGISPDGRYVVFDSFSSNLVPSLDTNLAYDVFLRDTVTGVTTLVSVNTSAIATGNDYSFGRALAGSGRFILFESYATDLGPSLAPNTRNVFLRDLLSTATATPTATPTPSPTHTGTHTPTPSLTATSSATRTASASGTPSHTPTMTSTFSATPARTPSVTASRTTTATATHSATATATRTGTASYSPTSTPTSSFTATRTFTVTATPTATPSPTHTSSSTPSRTATATPTPTPTASLTASRTATFSPTATRTASSTPSHSPTATWSVTASATRSPTATASHSPSPTASLTATQAPTASPTGTRTASYSPSHSPTATSSASATGTPSATATYTASASFTPTGSLTPTVTVTTTPSPSFTATPSATDSVTATPSPSVSATVTASATPTFPPTPVPSPTASATENPTATLSVTATGTPTASATASPSSSYTASSTPTASPTYSATLAPTASPSGTTTSTVTITPSVTPSRSNTMTPTTTASTTRTATVTPSRTASPTFSTVPTVTPSVTVSPSATVTSTSSATPLATTTPSMTPSVTATFTATASATSSFSATPVWTATPTEVLRASPTGSPTLSPTVSPSFTVLPASPTPTRTASSTPTATESATPTQVASVSPTPTEAQSTCVGDCSGDGEVTVDELIMMVNVALGSTDLVKCLSADADSSGEVTVDEIVAAVSRSLNGCGTGLEVPSSAAMSCIRTVHRPQRSTQDPLPV
jgi:hypothetical protein